MTTPSIRSLVRNAAAVFSGSSGAATRRAEEAGRSRQSVYEHARRVERRLQTEPVTEPEPVPVAVEAPAARPALDAATKRRFAATAFAMGVSLRQVEDLLRVLLGDDAPHHSTPGRRVEEEAERAGAVLEVLDAAAAPRIRTLAVDEVFWGGGRPWWGSSPPA